MAKQQVTVKRRTVSLSEKIPIPDLPVKWDVVESIEKMHRILYKWGQLTEETMCELWIARTQLSVPHRPLSGPDVPVTWAIYCEKVGIAKRTANRWLAYWFTEASLVGKLTGNAENYTPKDVVADVCTVLGSIDLDPASCRYAQKVIKAKKYYTAEDSSLEQPWAGRVFLNPPYGMPLIRDFTDKLVLELPNIDAAILLTNDQTDTLWWQKAAVSATLICLPQGRLHFYTPDKDETSPTNGQTFFYYGPDAEKFKAVFASRGLIVTEIP